MNSSARRFHQGIAGCHHRLHCYECSFLGLNIGIGEPHTKLENVQNKLHTVDLLHSLFKKKIWKLFVGLDKLEH